MIHNNPVEEGIVFRPEDYKYSSAPDYAGEKGLLDNICVFQYFKFRTTRRDSRGSGGGFSFLFISTKLKQKKPIFQWTFQII